ncbi:hypothetical protein ColTof4_07694 [Colletotrichum tofieldiae]|uniref:NTF2-like protein n=1 Tax=Colletotrichum tofieldiae TaxID=708197 RepID=A0A161YK08_9PEZI|nr:hypothetical protein CT0861_03639 [Colletotrichum tofieldiae]GKT55439.1 hypothetical protein ColTof3_02778 [Colletotrichum tofieldiae]GKT75271.1 hypothetical protein ColTof4_07694 [Colletotrichum tofieldiae]
MAATYKQFLTAPNSSLLAPNATLYYITTTTTYSGPTEIIKHLNTLRNQVKKKKEEILDVVEGRDAIAAEVDTSLEFVTSGGAYLPGLDDNFLADRTVYLPIMHVVNFDGDGRIVQIRQTWDQGALLKQCDIIGKSGRNWPIRDSTEQIKLITKGLKASGKVETAPDTNELINRSRGSSSNVLRDPHASLSLFAPREQQAEESPRAVVSPYAGTRPQQRSFNDILGNAEPDEPGSPSAGRERDESPSKAVAPKSGAGKNFQPSRLFDADEHADVPDSPEQHKSPEKFYRPNPKKYQHFDFADGSDPQDTPKPAEGRPKASKHDSNWSFDDFVTPQKIKPGKTLRTQDVRHWDTDINNSAIKETPVARAAQVKGRRDAEAHFDFEDDGPAVTPRPPGRPKGTGHNTGLHLYENNLYSEDGKPLPADSDRALGNITNLNHRHKDFDPHFAMTDDSPNQAGQQGRPAVSDSRKKAVTQMNSNWDSYDQSPAAQKENRPEAQKGPGSGIHIAGDGMGSKKTKDDQDAESKGIHIAGDGMGGKKGANRNWLYGDVDEPEEPVRAIPPKGSGMTAAQKSFWDF